MAKQVEVVGRFDGADYYEDMAAEQAALGKWTIFGTRAECNFGTMTVEQLVALFDSWSDDLDNDELAEIEALAVGELAEIERGRGCWYEVTAV